MARIGKADHPRILRMVDVEGRKVAEVAAEYGCTPANIYALLGKLRRAVAPEEGPAQGDEPVPAGKPVPAPVCVASVAPAEDGTATLDSLTAAASGQAAADLFALMPAPLAIPDATPRTFAPATTDPDLLLAASGPEPGDSDSGFDPDFAPETASPPPAAEPPPASPALARSEAAPRAGQPSARPALAAAPPQSPARITEFPERGRSPARGGVGARLAKPGVGLVMRAGDGDETTTPFRSLEDLLSAVKPMLRAAARSPEPVWFSIQQVDLAEMDSDAA